MEFIVHPEVFERFPGMRIVVVVARGLDNTSARAPIAARWREAWAGAAPAAVHGNAQSHPRVRRGAGCGGALRAPLMARAFALLVAGVGYLAG